ncbi:L,D-transpeptidase family protein [Kribbella sp. NPDC048915]|uniref:L,D-transpeptidase family protein n=1 Tax=Kribbella sp. NPDC048915 TaxID=3155148 RepID=UPI0034053FDC
MRILPKLGLGTAAVTLVGLVGPGAILPAEALTVSQVKVAQSRLNALGCGSGPVDGKAGAMTQAATVRFQSANALSQTGSLNSTTYARLRASTAKRCDVRPVPRRSGTGRRIVLSQSQNWVWLIDARGKVVRQGGIIDNPKYLKAGTYTSGSKCGRAGRIARNTDGGRLYLNRFVRFAPCGIGFHQIPTYKSNGRQIHADYLLGTNYRASHGCIRVSASMSSAIWSFTTSATRVVVMR